MIIAYGGSLSVDVVIGVGDVILSGVANGSLRVFWQSPDLRPAQGNYIIAMSIYPRQKKRHDLG